MVCEEQDLLDEGYGAVIYSISTAENNKDKQTRTLFIFALGTFREGQCRSNFLFGNREKVTKASS